MGVICNYFGCVMRLRPRLPGLYCAAGGGREEGSRLRGVRCQGLRCSGCGGGVRLGREKRSAGPSTPLRSAYLSSHEPGDSYLSPRRPVGG